MNIDEVRKRLKQGKTPWNDDRHKERIDIALQKNWIKFRDHPEKEVFTLVSNSQRTTQAKSLPKKPDERKLLERRIHAVKKEPISTSSSSRPMTKEQQKSEE